MSELTCPDCGTTGEHQHPTDDVRSCNECGYCAGKAAFTEQA